MLIKNAYIVDPVSKFEGTKDIRIANGKITEVGINLDEVREEVLDAKGQVVAPGLVDIHVHFRDPGLTYKEDIFTGAKAAAKGGFTTVICMANTKPVIDSVDLLKTNQEKMQKACIRVLQASTITKGLEGKKLVDLKAMHKAGCAGFTDDGIPIMDEELLKEAMEIAKELDEPISLHEEDPTFLDSPGVNKGEVSKKIGVGGASAMAEDVLVARDVMIALHTGAKVNIQHISSKNSVELVRTAKKLGANVFAEATPHHFTLTEEAVLEHGTLARMNPPLRTEEDRQAIIRGLQDGTIDFIATDHAPHSAEEKAQEFAKAPSGITGLETSLGLGVTTLVRGGYLTLMQLMEKMSANPAELYHLENKGITVGANADLVIFNPEETFIVGNYASKATNSPFTGKELYGAVKYTIYNGEVVYRG
ncbi:Dihydroorotase [Lachnospiraceae bacterium TWA4]|nr:Dihydroorotase [Lachnospiraceae bacterium TWA4]